jgi:stress response protein SCP2
VSEEVSSIWLVVNIYRKSFDEVQWMNFSILSQNGNPFCKFEMNFDKDVAMFNGNFACVIKRSEIASKEWTIKALGYYSRECHNYNDMIPIVT